MIESPVRTYLLLGFLLLAESLCPALEAFAMKGFVDAFVDLNAPLLGRTALFYLGVMVYGAVIAGAGVSARVRLVEDLARR